MTSHIPQHDEHKEMSDWFISLFPKIRPAFIADDGCWIASMMTRSSDHNPPWAWIGWAFDSVSERGGFSRLQERMIKMHGEKSCRGQEVLDEAVRQLVTETCATAWSLKRFGSNNFPLSNGAHIENSTSGNWVVSNDGDTHKSNIRLRCNTPTCEIARDTVYAVTLRSLVVATAQIRYQCPIGARRQSRL